MAVKRVKAGIMGAGVISYTYLENLCSTFSIVEVAGISDMNPEKSAIRSEQFGVRRMTNDEILDDPEIEIVINLTIPTVHQEISEAALRAGKNVYSEKVMALEYEGALSIFNTAKEKKLRFGQAPDTFLGGALQTARKLIDDGYIGDPIMAQAMVVRGSRLSDASNTQVRFAFGPGGSVPFDMTGYYLHALVSLLGPVKRVAGFSRNYGAKVFENPRNPKYKTSIDSLEPGIMTGSLEFYSGCVAALTAVGECRMPEVPRLEIYGREGTLICPDPNYFGGAVYLARGPGGERHEIPLTHGFVAPLRSGPPISPQEAIKWEKSCRGVGVADMAWAMRNGRPHRCSAELGLHACEIARGIEKSGENGLVYNLQSKPERPAALPAGFVTGTGIDESCLDDSN